MAHCVVVNMGPTQQTVVTTLHTPRPCFPYAPHSTPPAPPSIPISALECSHALALSVFLLCRCSPSFEALLCMPFRSPPPTTLGLNWELSSHWGAGECLLSSPSGPRGSVYVCMCVRACVCIAVFKWYSIPSSSYPLQSIALPSSLRTWILPGTHGMRPIHCVPTLVSVIP